MNRSLRKIRRLVTTTGRAGENLVILHARFPDRDTRRAQRDEFHAERIRPRLSRLRADTSFEPRGQKRLLLRRDSPVIDAGL